MATGYVKLHRSIESHWVFADDAMFYLFTNLILRANWKPGKVWTGGDSAPITIERGQLLTGRNALHRMLYPTHDKHGKRIRRESAPPHPVTLWRWLESLEKDGMIRLDVRSQFTIITVCNYETYQGADEVSAPAVRQGRASGAPAVRRPCAADAPAVRTIEEGEEGEEGKDTPLPPRGRRVRNVDRSYSPEFLRFWSVFPSYRKTNKPDAWMAWQQAVLRCPPEAILAAATEYASSVVGRGEYVRGPAPWLRGDAWDDDRAGWQRSMPGAAPVKRQKSKQELDDSLRYEITAAGRKAGKTQAEIDEKLILNGLQP